MTKYDIIFEALQEKVDSGELSLEEAELVNDVAFEKYICEAEEDHLSHMKYKEKASKRSGISQDKMINKKYKKNPEKADLYYKGRERLIQNDRENNNGNSYLRDKPVDKKGSGIDDKNYSRFFYDIEIGDKDIATKALTYMQNHTNLENPREYKNYKIAFNIFCRRFNIPENSSLWIKFNPGYERRTRIGHVRVPDKMTIGAYEDKKPVKVSDSKDKKKMIQSKESKIKLPNGYKLIHTSRENNLLQLNPVSYSNKYISRGPGGIGGQYHSTGRIYFTLIKNDTSKIPESYGKHMYELVSPVEYIYFDTEHLRCFDDEDMKNLDIDKLLNKPVYVKTNTPLRVKKYKS